ncbi:MAG: hypothetical protein ABIR58_07045 [Gemmatimonadaceae bacterium]
MASDRERPDVAFDELQQLVRHLGDELATFRRRAMQAESRIKAIDSSAGSARVNPERVDRLERENAELRKRVESARTRTRLMLDRLRFLRQQHDGAAR